MARTSSKSISTGPFLRAVLWPCTLLAALSCSYIDITSFETQTEPKTTYEKHLPKALASDPDAQYMLGFMFLHGEGVPVNYDQAHEWFHLAADQGHKAAQRLLGIIHSRALPRIPEPFYNLVEANYWFSRLPLSDAPSDTLSKTTREYEQMLAQDSDLRRSMRVEESGRSVYVHFCAPCHGIDGDAVYPNTPSFSKGERMDNSDTELLHSIIHGKGAMPAWGAAVPLTLVENALAYIRYRFTGPVLPSPPAAGKAEVSRLLSSVLMAGEHTFVTLCAGCHGFNGIAYYVHSPSFVLGERMHKSDAELIRSIRGGKGAMPGWGGKITGQEMEHLIAFIRSLAPAYEAGIIGEIRKPESRYFLFWSPTQNGKKWIPKQPAEID